MVTIDNSTLSPQGMIVFPKDVRPPTKCTTHTHRRVITGSRHGVSIFEVRTVKIYPKVKHDIGNCITLYPTNVR